MGTFKWIGNNNYFNPLCTSDLVFDNKDSSTERLFCEESTCVDAHYAGTGVVSACKTAMLPSGYTDKNFEWGVEGGPWTAVVNTTGNFPSSPNEFIGRGRLTKIKQPTDPAGKYYNIRVFNNRQQIVFNTNAFSNEFDIQDTSSAGYAPSIKNTWSIDPERSIGSVIYDPYFNPSICGMTHEVYDEPEISYYNVGEDPVVPEPHDVVFEDANLLGSGEWRGLYDGNDTSTAAANYWRDYIRPGQPDAIAYGASLLAYAGSPNHPTMPPLSYYPEWNYNHVAANQIGAYVTVRVGTNSRNARVYHPLADTNDSTKVLRGTTSGPEWHTGYRMQSYNQLAHQVTFGLNGANLQFKMRSINTRIRPLGYYATWVLKSIVPKYIYFPSTRWQAPWYYHRWAVKAQVTVTVTYKKFNETLNPAAMYEYGSTLSQDAPVTCGRNRVYDTPSKWSPPWNRWSLALTAGCNSTLPSYLNSTTLGNHWAISYYDINFPSGGWQFQMSHSAGSPPTDLTDPKNPKSRKSINYYTYPLSWSAGPFLTGLSTYVSPTVDQNYISYQSQKFSSIFNKGSVRTSSPYPLTPNNFKIWRRKI